MVYKFNIDTYTRKVLPRVNFDRFPLVIRFILGKHEVTPKSDYWIWLEVLISTFCGLALLEGVFKSHTVFLGHHAPMIIASYGATAILCFNASQVPLAQPRNIFFGHFISSLIGVCISKLFGLSEGGRENYWASGALSVAVASVLMSLLNCVHPPAGASALLPSVDSQIRSMSWWYLPAQIISSILIICVSLITGNVFRRYPVYWFVPDAVKDEVKEKKEDLETQNQKNIVITEDDFHIPLNVQLSDDEFHLLKILQSKICT